MLIYPRYLSFEVTRRCNLRCMHCMRGDAQDLDMSEDVVKSVLDSIRELHYINFTGGEPSLNIPLIRFIVDEIIARRIRVYGFDVVTNGVDSEKVAELIEVLSRLKEHCFDKNISSSRLALSVDNYHQKAELPCIKCNFELQNKSELTGILNLGRARYLDCPKSAKERSLVDVVRQLDAESVMLNNSIVVSANGDVRLSVDYEYASKEDVIGNVREKPLGDVISDRITMQKLNPYDFWF